MNEINVDFLIHKLHWKSKALSDKQLEQFGLTIAQARILGYLHQHENMAYQKDIEHFHDVSHPTIVGIVSRLEKNGFVKVEIDQNDKRNRIIHNTQKGIDFCEATKGMLQKRNLDMIEGFSEDDLERFKGYLFLVSTNLNKLLEKEGLKND